MAENDRLLIAQLDVSIRALERSMKKAGIHVDRASERMENRWQRMNRRVTQRSNQMASDVRRAIAGVAIGLASREVIQYADAWTEAGNKIAAAGTPLEQQTVRLRELSATAIETRSSFDATASLYARLGIATENLSGKSYDLLKVTELINKATVAGGASTAERNSTVMQLSQALASGQLMGEELRALRENAPLLMQALAAEFDTTIGKLKDLGAEGKLTAERVLDAILSAEGDIEDRFSKTNVTIGDSFTNLQTRVTEYIGTMDDSLGASEKLAGAIMFVADNVDAFAEGLVIAGAALTGALGAQAALAVVNGLNSIAAGATGAARAMALLRAASAFFLGPAGIVMGVGAAAAALAYFAIQGDKAKSATERLNAQLNDAETELRNIAEAAGIPWETIRKGAEETIGPIDETTRYLRELNAELEKSGALARQNAINSATVQIMQATQARADALAEIDRIENKREFRRAGNMAQKAAEIEAATEALERAERQIAEGRALRDRIFADTTNEDFKHTSTRTGGGGREETDKEIRERDARIEAARKALKELDDAFKTTYQIERDEAEKTFQQQIKAMDELGVKGQERRNRELQAEIAYRNEVDRIDAEEAAEIKRIEDERIRAKEEQTDREIDLLRQVLDARDQLSGRYFAIMEREFQRKRELIFEEIKDEERRHEALIAMAEERRIAEQRIRDEAAGRGEYSSNREAADIMRAQREGAERTTNVNEKLNADLADLEARYQQERALVAEDDEAKLAMLEGYLATEHAMILEAEEIKRAIWLESAQLQAAAVEQGLTAATGAMRTAFSEQSGIYKAFFVLQKGAAIAAAAIATQQNIAEASKVGFPQNLAFMAAAAAQGATILASMRAIQATFGGGRERGGPVGPNEFYEVNEKGKPELLNANGRYYLMSGGYGKVEPANAMPSIPDLSSITQPNIRLPSTSRTYTINSPVTIQGSVDKETLPDLMRELNARDQRLLEAARAQTERDLRNTTPRHERDRFWRL